MSDFRTTAIQNNYYGVEIDIAKGYASSLDKHITHVQEAAQMLQVPKKQIEIHDQSKWSEAEFPGYAHYSYSKSIQDEDEFAMAWLHHLHYNPHHWQWWILSDGFTPTGSNIENGVVEMPKNFALEMVADWMGSEFHHTGNWDMKEWLWISIPKIKVHSETAKYLKEVLDNLGYTDTVNVKEFGKGF